MGRNASIFLRFAACLGLMFLAACSPLLPLGVSGPGGLPDEFRFFQAGEELRPQHGVVRLAPGPFSIRYRGPGQAPSIFASSNPLVAGQLAGLKGPLLAWVGTGLAAYPDQLFVTEDPLELYAGWSAEFEKEWGGIFTGQNRRDFEAYFQKFSDTPWLLASGRNYANFVEQADGSFIYRVSRLSGKDETEVVVGRLYVVLFVDAEPAGNQIKPYALRGYPMVLEFRQAGEETGGKSAH